MPTQRLSMRRIKQLLTMRFGARAIARELGVAPSTVREYLSRVAASGIDWPLAADVTDESLMTRLFVNAGVRSGARYHAEPDWPVLVCELKRPGVNLLVLWEEYRAVYPLGYAYSRIGHLVEHRWLVRMPRRRDCRKLFDVDPAARLRLPSTTWPAQNSPLLDAFRSHDKKADGPGHVDGDIPGPARLRRHGRARSRRASGSIGYGHVCHSEACSTSRRAALGLSRPYVSAATASLACTFRLVLAARSRDWFSRGLSWHSIFYSLPPPVRSAWPR